MTDPKTFTGPGGYTFRIEGRNVFIGQLSGPHPAGLIVPLAELGAFLQQPETAAAFDALAPSKPIDFSQGTFTQPTLFNPPPMPEGGNYSNVLPEPTIDGQPIAWTEVPVTLDDYGPRAPRVIGRTVGSYVAEPDLCPSCAKRMAEARQEGKSGIVLCGRCAAQENPSAPDLDALSPDDLGALVRRSFGGEDSRDAEAALARLIELADR